MREWQAFCFRFFANSDSSLLLGTWLNCVLDHRHCCQRLSQGIETIHARDCKWSSMFDLNMKVLCLLLSVIQKQIMEKDKKYLFLFRIPC